MTRMVYCLKYQQELEGLNAPPVPGIKGKEIYDNYSKQAWLDWQSLQTRLINEKHLNMMEKEHRQYLTEQRDKFSAAKIPIKPKAMFLKTKINNFTSRLDELQAAQV